jgi:hypothetical protein
MEERQMKLIKASDGCEYTRSRWLTIKQNYNPTKKNKLWDYVIDGSGYHPYQEKFNPDDGLFLEYFKYKGRLFAIEQFMVIGSVWNPGEAPYYEDKEGNHTLSAFDSEEYFHPYYIEIDDCGEHVRVYEEV